jgi:HEAT repeat protein
MEAKVMRSNKYLRLVSLLAILVIGGLLISGCAPNIEKLEEKQDIEGLIRALDYEDSRVRERAAGILGNIGDSRAVEPLIKALGDEEYFVRSRAAGALGNIGEHRAVEPLIKALRDEYLLVRQGAAGALGNMGDSRVIEPLIKALGDEDVISQAAEALGNIGEPAVGPLIKALGDEDVRSGAAEALENMGEPAVEPLIEALGDGDFLVKKYIVVVLIKIGDERAIWPLIRVLNEYDDKDIAEYFLNCGHPQLEEAATIWAKNNGYEIIKTPDGGGGPSWGQ